jgi:hypothetical protein
MLLYPTCYVVLIEQHERSVAFRDARLEMGGFCGHGQKWSQGSQGPWITL